MTQLAKAFADKGITHINVEFNLAIAKFQNKGGIYDVALAMLNAAYGKGSGGQIISTGVVGHIIDADASLTNDGEADQIGAAHQAETVVSASPSSQREVAVSAHERHWPGHARRGLAEIGSVQETVANSLFDTVMLPDGRRLRDVRWSECPALATKYRRLSHILIAVHNSAIPPDPNATLDAIVTERELKQILTAAEKIND